jgi:hypothetical protein
MMPYHRLAYRRWFLVGCALCAVLFVVGLAASRIIASNRHFARASIEVSAAVDSTFAELARGQFSRVYWEATTPEFRGAMTEAQFGRLGTAINDVLGELKSKRVVQVALRRQGGQQWLKTEFQGNFERGDATIRVYMTKGGSGWRYFAFEVVSPAFSKSVGLEAK